MADTTKTTASSADIDSNHGDSERKVIDETKLRCRFGMRCVFIDKPKENTGKPCQRIHEPGSGRKYCKYGLNCRFIDKANEHTGRKCLLEHRDRNQKDDRKEYSRGGKMSQPAITQKLRDVRSELRDHIRDMEGLLEDIDDAISSARTGTLKDTERSLKDILSRLKDM